VRKLVILETVTATGSGDTYRNELVREGDRFVLYVDGIASAFWDAKGTTYLTAKKLYAQLCQEEGWTRG
jgi:hypothetical protein